LPIRLLACARSRKPRPRFAAIVRTDPDALALFGNVTGNLTRAYFVSDGECEPASEEP
jgi:hypothetical protein